ncbi:hypothetical protein HAX54_010272, partial [Datura stramonium]|nr:hypothetical protein [Datura stramonium]
TLEGIKANPSSILDDIMITRSIIIQIEETVPELTPEEIASSFEEEFSRLSEDDKDVEYPSSDHPSYSTSSPLAFREC